MNRNAAAFPSRTLRGLGALLLLLFARPAAAAEPTPTGAQLLDALAARSIGPANMGGRIVDLAVVENSPATMYVATASGGLWKTTDGGDTWTPAFDHQGTSSLGA